MRSFAGHCGEMESVVEVLFDVQFIIIYYHVVYPCESKTISAVFSNNRGYSCGAVVLADNMSVL